MGNMQMLMHNVTMVIPSVTFNGESTFRAMQREKATTLYGTVLHGAYPFSSTTSTVCTL